jgi:hypothetical protein
VLYPGWISASAYKQTNESFDTIALRHSDLHRSLKTRRELGNITLTKDPATGVKEDCWRGQHNDSEGYDVVTIENPAFKGVVNPADSTANLHFDEHEANKKDSDDFDDDTTPCIQHRYVTAKLS